MSTETETGQRRRRRVRLTPMRSIPVKFTGERAGEGPLTLGQLDCYMWLSQAPDQFYAILCADLPVPTVVSVDDVAEAPHVLELEVLRVAQIDVRLRRAVDQQHPRARPVEVTEQLDGHEVYAQSAVS